MNRILSLVLGALLLTSIGLALPQEQQKATLQCTLTGEKIAECCCQQREGKLYCPLAKKTIDNCCCKSLSGK